MTSDTRRPRARVVIRVDPLLHRLIAPIVADLSLLAFVVLSIAAASLVSHSARHESARTPQGPEASHTPARVASPLLAEPSGRSR